MNLFGIQCAGQPLKSNILTESVKKINLRWIGLIFANNDI